MKRLANKFFLFVLVVLQAIAYPRAAAAGSRRSGSVESRPRHFVFLVHGISGSAKTFGALPEVLAGHLAQLRPHVDFRVIPLAYKTGDPNYTTYDFARFIGDQMLAQVGAIEETDRF